jgi:hypothetical protein
MAAPLRSTGHESGCQVGLDRLVASPAPVRCIAQAVEAIGWER